jgi:hypothetical protein
MNAWLAQVFEADIANNHGIVRRNKSDVEKYSSHHDLLQDVRSRGFHLIETGDQFVIICNQGSIQIHC